MSKCCNISHLNVFFSSIFSVQIQTYSAQRQATTKLMLLNIIVNSVPFNSDRKQAKICIQRFPPCQTTAQKKNVRVFLFFVLEKKIAGKTQVKYMNMLYTNTLLFVIRCIVCRTTFSLLWVHIQSLALCGFSFFIRLFPNSLSMLRQFVGIFADWCANIFDLPTRWSYIQIISLIVTMLLSPEQWRCNILKITLPLSSFFHFLSSYCSCRLSLFETSEW